MTREQPHTTYLSQPGDRRAELYRDLVDGMRAAPRQLPSKWFYDARGSELFEQITSLEVYYPTRTEDGLLREHADALVAAAEADELVELGSGSSTKTRRLLEAMRRHRSAPVYVPLDVSAAAIEAAAAALQADYPWLRVRGYVGDFESDLPSLPRHGRRLLAMLGSTLGNFDERGRTGLLRAMRAACDAEDRLLLGADLVKDEARLVAAYDDRAGVTAAFNRNVLEVIARELQADVEPDAFAHDARWNASRERIEMWLVARRATAIGLPDGNRWEFGPGEGIRTELSTKFRRDGLTGELAAAGFAVERWVSDRADDFAVLLARPT